MHLKKISIQGFKSFADRTEIEFKEGITAIVGPNGSGKSNVADAIRWVLGEQSVKVLRGNKMEDVIFSGTDSRKALGYAEVTIVFDNTEGTIPIDYQEVAITRRMFRSGESEYYINRNSCRLKDVRELFMDTGIGKDGYSIIGQGRIDEILSTRPEDRRNIFEEAVGITKYKLRKSEAQKKLESTNNNLVRIKDIILELENQHDNLKEQSDRAKAYLELSNKAREIEVNLLIREIEALEAEMENIRKERKEVDEYLNLLLAEKKEIEEKLNELKRIIEQKNKIHEVVESQRDNVSNSINHHVNQLNLLEEKIKYYRKDIQRLKDELESLNGKLENLKTDKEYLLEISMTREEELNVNREDFMDKNAEVNRLNEKIKSSEEEIQRGKDRILELYNLAAEKKSKLNSILSFKDNISRRIAQIQKEVDLLSIKKEEREDLLSQLMIEEAKKNKEIIDGNKYLTNLRLDEERIKADIEKLQSIINQNKIDLQSNIANFNMLKNMEQDYEGYYKGVKNLMLACKKEDKLKNRLIGVVAELIRVDEKYEKAIEVALGSNLQNVVTKDEDDAKYIINYLREKKLGRVTFLPLTNIKGNPIHINDKDKEVDNIVGIGSELVLFDERYRNIVEYLLGRTIVVEDLDSATKVAKKFNYSFKVVTLEGDIINPGGSITGGSLPKVNNLLNRKHRIEKIKEEINELIKTQEKLELDKSRLYSELEKYSDQIKQQENKLQSINISVVKIENEKNKFNLEINGFNESIEKYNKEIDQLNSEMELIYKDESQLKEEINQINDQIETVKEQIEELIKKHEEDKKVLQKALDEVTDFKIQINLMENKIMDSKEKLALTEKEIEQTESAIFNKEQEIDNLEESIENISNDIIKTKSLIDQLNRQKDSIDEEIAEIKSQRDQLMKEFYLIQDSLKEINDKVNVYEKEKNKWNIRETKCNVNLDNAHAKLMEEYELDYEDARKLWVHIDNLDEAKKEVLSLKNNIKELGHVNLNAIEDYKSVKERLDFITKQHDDLLMAKKDLEDVIVDMEEKMKKQFEKGFDAINEEFSRVFSKLFNGGKASLELEDKDDILNCGIDIKVQPPGKKLQTLNLLSGGEKSLTAVALLFAIMNIKPAPFCILDEIDAALDDANINKYAAYLRELSKDTQFIVITHRKGTMEMADVLYGVTMEEKGISKVISVKLTDKIDEIAS